MGQTPSVRPEESKATEPEQSIPEITSGNSQGVPVDNNPSVFRAAKTKFKIKKIHVTIGLIATVVVILVILIGVLFSKISSLEDKTKKQEESLKEKENENKAAITELKARDMKTNVTIAALEAELKAKDISQLTNIVNKAKHVEVGDVDCYKFTPQHIGIGWTCTYSCIRQKNVTFNQNYDTPPNVAVSLNHLNFKQDQKQYGVEVTSVGKSYFTVTCETSKRESPAQKMEFTWISIPKV